MHVQVCNTSAVYEYRQVVKQTPCLMGVKDKGSQKKKTSEG